MKRLPAILTDLLGVMLIVIAPLLGWLPGPGGIPMFIAGLTLLSLNHHWAKRLLEYLKQHGSKLAEKLIYKNIWLYRLVDLIGVALVVYGLIIMPRPDKDVRVYGAIATCVGVIILLLTRERYKKFIR